MRKTVLQQLNEIENVIYSHAYDDLSNYLQGIRDMINLLNNDEQEEGHELIDTIKEQLKNIGD